MGPWELDEGGLGPRTKITWSTQARLRLRVPACTADPKGSNTMDDRPPTVARFAQSLHPKLVDSLAPGFGPFGDNRVLGPRYSTDMPKTAEGPPPLATGYNAQMGSICTSERAPRNLTACRCTHIHICGSDL